MDFVDETASRLRVVAEDPLDRDRLDLVAVRRRRAVRVDVRDLVRVRAGVTERVAHDAERAVAVLRRRGDVVRVAGHPVAGDLGVDRRAARLRVGQVLEDQDARALAEDEAVPVLVPGPRRGRRVVVARRERAHRREAADRERRDDRLGAARDHRVRVAPADDVRGVADRVGGRRAGRRAVAVFGPFAPGQDRDEPRRHVDDETRDEERADPAGPLLEDDLVRLLDERQPADPRADAHADALGVLGSSTTRPESVIASFAAATA